MAEKKKADVVAEQTPETVPYDQYKVVADALQEANDEIRNQANLLTKEIVRLQTKLGVAQAALGVRAQVNGGFFNVNKTELAVYRRKGLMVHIPDTLVPDPDQTFRLEVPARMVEVFPLPEPPAPAEE